jgi:simple sugar transport system permease protein
MKFDARKLGLALAAPVLAIVVALLLTTLILIAAGDPVVAVWQVLFKAPLPRQIVAILNEATVLYLSAVAVAIGFKMNLFNIGVDGQYRIASFTAAVFAGANFLPGWLNIIVSILIAMVTGAVWAAIAGFLKVTRGVSEVISTIMLNYIATYLVAFMLKGAAVDIEGSNATSTAVIAEGSRVPGISLQGLLGTGREVYGLIFLSIAMGIVFWFVLTKTRFGFDLRATGQSETAAIASGVNVKRMVITSMVLSGAVAGLVGMPLLFGQDYAYGDTVQAGLGFAGLSVALLGRNHPVGMAVAALLWGYLNQLSNGLQIGAGVSDKLVLIIQGIIVLSVVIAYELVRRAGLRMEQRRVARELAAQPGPEAKEVAA